MQLSSEAEDNFRGVRTAGVVGSIPGMVVKNNFQIKGMTGMVDVELLYRAIESRPTTSAGRFSKFTLRFKVFEIAVNFGSDSMY